VFVLRIFPTTYFGIIRSFEFESKRIGCQPLRVVS
jgi:hypothetical protein